MSDLLVRIDVQLPRHYLYAVDDPSTGSPVPPPFDVRPHIPPGQADEHIRLSNHELAEFVKNLTDPNAMHEHPPKNKLIKILSKRVAQLSRVSETLALVEHQFRELLRQVSELENASSSDPIRACIFVDEQHETSGASIE